MPRKSSSSGRPVPRPVPKPVRQSPPPAANTHAPPPAPLQSGGGGSVLGSIGGAIADGMAFGTGSAIAHRVVDSVMGPRVVQHEHTTVTAAAPAAAGPVTSSLSPVSNAMSDSCTSQAKAFQDCISANGSDIGKCQFYLDMLNECKKAPTGTYYFI